MMSKTVAGTASRAPVEMMQAIRWLRAVGAVGLILVASPSIADVIVRHASCPPGAPPPRTEICAEGPLSVPVSVHLTDASGGTLVAGGSASATAVRAVVSNTFGGSGRVTASFRDDYTLSGPGAGPLTFTATLTVDGLRSSTMGTVGAGFLATGASYYAAPASMLYSLGGGPTGAVSETLVLSLTQDIGDTFSLGFGVDLIALMGVTLDFGSTVTLGFTGLPDGVFISSTQGFDGVGSRPATPPVAVPLPGSLGLSLLAGFLCAMTARRGRRSPHRA